MEAGILASQFLCLITDKDDISTFFFYLVRAYFGNRMWELRVRGLVTVGTQRWKD